jgi:uncharacterized membrane protein
MTFLDIVAITWFLGCWIGYTLFSRHHAKAAPNLMEAVHTYRKRWMARVVEAEEGPMHAVILNGLAHTAVFLVSTTVLIVGGLLATLGATEAAVKVFATVPFAVGGPEWLWVSKTLFLVTIFLYAAYRFTWSLRQFNFCSIMVGAAPDKSAAPDEKRDFIERASQVACLAGDNFNAGLRAYYLGFVTLGWFVHPLLWIGGTAIMLLVLYRREFHSPIVRALTGDLASQGRA